jgi:hypothetical protein
LLHCLFAVGTLLVRTFDISALEYINSSVKPAFKLIISIIIKTVLLSIFDCGLFFVISMFYPVDYPIACVVSKNYRFLFIGVLIFLVSSNKSNDLLIFTIALLIMATNHIEIPQIKLKQEMVLIVLIACSFFAFFSQL